MTPRSLIWAMIKGGAISKTENRKRNGCGEVVEREDDEFNFLLVEFEELV